MPPVASGTLSTDFSAALQRLSAEERAAFRTLVEIFEEAVDPDEKAEAIAGITELLDLTPITFVPFESSASGPSKPTPFAEFVGKKIREHRERAGLDQTALAERCGLTQSHISRLESGKHCPNAKTRERLGKALGVDPREFEAGAD